MKSSLISKKTSSVSYLGSWGGLGNSIFVEENSATGYFKQGSPLAKDDNTLLIENTDFVYGQRLDSGTYNIYDTGASGALASGKYFRIVDSVTNKNIKDVTGLAFTEVVAHVLPSVDSPADKIAWVDPVSSMYKGVNQVAYWSKCENAANLTTAADIALYSPYIVSGSSMRFTPGKFNNGWQQYVSGGGEIALRTYGDNLGFNRGTFTCWGMMEHAGGVGYGYANIGDGGLAGAGKMSIGYWYLSYPSPTCAIGYGIDSVFTVVTFTPNAYQHIYAVWDSSGGLAGGKTIRIYVNSVEVLSSSTTFDTSASIMAVTLNGIYPGYGSDYAIPNIDNIILYESVIDDPSWSWNGGAGQETPI